MRYELKLTAGRVVRWEGETPDAAMQSYADNHPGQAVIA